METGAPQHRGSFEVTTLEFPSSLTVKDFSFCYLINFFFFFNVAVYLIEVKM